ncbi:MAG: methionyl-tRNA formyltransferase [Limisphaerales bacterium]|jgi:methionyl-tRNA formyltransferase
MDKSLRIIFMGTPEFAVAPLKLLVEEGWNIVGVITAVDKPAGRKLKIKESAVKKYATDAGLNIMQPRNLKAEAFQTRLKALNADLQIVVAFRMLPESVWNMPALGTFNLHGSKLPAYRGAAPIHWAIINGEKQTGLTTFFLRHEIDTGAIIYSEDISISPEDTTGSLHDKMKEAGAKLVLKTVESIANGNAPSVDQDLTGEYPDAPKLYRESCQLDWKNDTTTIHNKVRGLSPFPGAWTFIEEDTMIKIYFGKIHNELPEEVEVDIPTELKSGKFHFTDKRIFIKTVDGWYEPTNVQLAGKRRMSTEEMLRGYRN